MIAPFIVDVPIFRMSVVVCANCSAQEAVDAFYQFRDCKAVLEPRNTDGWVQNFAGDAYMWVKDTDAASFVFHELVHVAFTICELKGMTYDEELIAYLVGWLKIEVADKLFDLAEGIKGETL